MTRPRSNRRCLDCGKTLAESLVDHEYRYDRGSPIRLRSIVKRSCTCGYWEHEIPRMGPLHETIALALRMLHVKRDALAFFFEEGRRGVEDGAWGVTIAQAGAP